jgi:hypothetical protein
MVDDFPKDYNSCRPHRAHGMMAPVSVQDWVGDRP